MPTCQHCGQSLPAPDPQAALIDRLSLDQMFGHRDPWDAPEAALPILAEFPTPITDAWRKSGGKNDSPLWAAACWETTARLSWLAGNHDHAEHCLNRADALLRA